jgi:hypothetical protein
MLTAARATETLSDVPVQNSRPVQYAFAAPNACPATPNARAETALPVDEAHFRSASMTKIGGIVTRWPEILPCPSRTNSPAQLRKSPLSPDPSPAKSILSDMASIPPDDRVCVHVSSAGPPPEIWDVCGPAAFSLGNMSAFCACPEPVRKTKIETHIRNSPRSSSFGFRVSALVGSSLTTDHSSLFFARGALYDCG